jgi:type I restriction enzyme, S subunit
VTDWLRDWPCIRLRDVCERTELTDPTRNPEETFLYVDVSSIDNEILEITSVNRLVGSQAPSRARKQIRAGDVIFATVRPTLRRIALVPPELDGQVCSTGYCVLRARSSVLDPQFLFFSLQTGGVSQEVEALQDGATYPAIRDGDLFALSIPLPPLEAQQDIARSLQAIRYSTACRRRELALERERKAALMHHLFTHGTGGETTKQTEIGEMPESWKIVRLGDVSQVAYGLTVNAARRNSTDTAPYLTVANITRGALKLGEIKAIGMLNGDAENYRLRAGDVLFVEGSGNPRLLGSAAVWNDDLPFALHQNHLIRARPDRAIVLPTWIMSYFNSDAGRDQLLGKATTSSGLHNINSRIISSLLLPTPPLSEQQVVMDILDASDRRRAAVDVEVAVLTELFHALLNALIPTAI